MTRLGTLAAMATAMAAPALAEDVAGKPVPGGINHQRPVTEVARDIIWLDDFMHVIMFAICIFVIGLLLYACMKFSRKNNPTPATWTHNTLIEVVWTAIPVIILVIIAIPSVKLLFLQLDVPEPDVTIKATGNQWYWTYEYPDEGVEFDANMIGNGATDGNYQLTDDVREQLKAAGYSEDEFLLATDNRVVVPVNANVHVLVTAQNVIHAWTIPSFGSKIDAIPGRINETWFRAEEVGVYFGQCSELCGMFHSYMPIVVEVVSQEDYETWILEQQALNGTKATTKVAAAE